MSENLKLRVDPPSGESQQDKILRLSDTAATADTAQNDDAESQMRKALGLLGDSPRHRAEPDRSDSAGRMGGDRFNGGLHRRRFVQDGDVPVTVLRRDQGPEVPAHRIATPSAPPQTSRLQRTEAALVAETAAREKSERLLIETQSIVRDLQTKIGHAELAKTEAIEALHNERDAAAQIRSGEQEHEVQLREALDQAQTAEANAQHFHDQLLEERQARKAAERALRTAEAARDVAEQLVRTLSAEEVPDPEPFVAPFVKMASPKAEKPRQDRRAWPITEPDVAEAASPRRTDVETTGEPEPVKWWLNTKPGTKRR